MALPLLFLTGKIHPQERTRGIIINHDNEILLVRNWFGRQKWTLPGGGKKSRESGSEALSREIFEETGIKVNRKILKHIGHVTYQERIAPLRLACYSATITKPQPVKTIGWELIEAKWYPLYNLPSDSSEVIVSAMKLLQNNE